MKEVIKETYQYTDEALQSGAVVSKARVVIMDRKVTGIQEGSLKVGEKVISFSAYENGGELYYNLSGVPTGVNGQGYVEEFVSSVEGSDK